MLPDMARLLPLKSIVIVMLTSYSGRHKFCPLGLQADHRSPPPTTVIWRRTINWIRSDGRKYPITGSLMAHNRMVPSPVNPKTQYSEYMVRQFFINLASAETLRSLELESSVRITFDTQPRTVYDVYKRIEIATVSGYFLFSRLPEN